MTNEKNEDLVNETDDTYSGDLSEEELNELVLQAQREALSQHKEESKPEKKVPKWFIWLLATTLFLSTFAGLFQVFSIPAIEFLKTSAHLSQQEDIATYKKSVVVVVTEDGKGTGFSVSSEGLILTNYHVIEENQAISVVFPDDGRFEATVVEKFPTIDLALLKIEGQELPFLSVDHSATMEMNDSITFIGNPLSFKGIANEGTILAPIKLSDWNEEVMMIQAPVYHGNSGSPVFNEDGDVIGVIFATLDHEEHGKVGLFVPLTLLKEYQTDKKKTRE